MRKAALIASFMASACSSSDEPPVPAPVVTVKSIEVDAGTVTGDIRPLWGDHYDLSFEHFDYPSEPGFSAVLADLAPRSWRCSVGRWEVGFPPPAGGDSTDPMVLAAVEREFYRGANTFGAADNPANYDFAYLDAQLASLVAEGLDPYLCFDYMPFTLAAEQDPFNANNANLNLPGTPYSTYSFSNGIRTSPPADPAVYARVVRNTIRHVRGLFAGTTDFGVEWFEIGNEPDVVDGTGAPLPFFWTGNELEFYDMYAQVAAEVDADVVLPQVQLGAGSFAFIPSMPGTAFLQAFVTRVGLNSPRLDYLSFHTYGDTPVSHLAQFLLVQAYTGATGVTAPWVNAEWGRDLGGTEPLYDQIGHGLIRTKVLFLMQAYPFVLAHEALYRDPGTSGGELGLTRTGPPVHKPVSRVYQALATFNDTTRALAVTSNPSELYSLPTTNVAGDRVLVAIVIDDPGPDAITRIDLDVTGLPFGPGAYDVTLSRVTESSAQVAPGSEVFRTESGSGGAASIQFDVPIARAGIYFVLIEEL